MAYTPQTWVDGSGGGTPISAARLNFMETGIDDADTRITAVEGRATSLESRATALEADTGWVNITIAATFAGLAAPEVPQVRRYHGVVYIRGGWANTGITASGSFTVGTLPTGYWPLENIALGIGSSSQAAAATGNLLSNGQVRILTSATVGSWYKFGGISWLTT